MSNSLGTIFFQRAHELSDSVAVRFKEGRSPYKSQTWKQFSELVRQLAFGLASRNVEPRSGVAIFSATSHLWVAADFATMSNGAASVPIYPTSSQSDVEFILENSEARVVFCQNEQLLKKAIAAAKKVQNIHTLVLMSSPSKGRTLTDIAKEEKLAENFLIDIDTLLAEGKKLSDKEPQLLDDRLAKIEGDDPATIIYTSGTTGTPKGVLLTHNNIIVVLNDLIKTIPINKDDTYLSYLPMSHVLERVCGELYWMHSGGGCAFAEGIETMAKNMAEVQPTMMLVVPRVLDKIYSKVKSGIDGASGKARTLIDWAIRVGIKMERIKAEGRTPNPVLQFSHWTAEKLVFRKLRERINPRLRLVVSGGAPATPQTIEFFNAIGICTLEGYGLTETSAPATVNLINKVKVGTVGPALPCVEIKLAEDGEIMLKGPSIFKGYYKNEQATKESFEDGWFKTGDIGTMDKDGYLKITDRKKDLIVNSSGKNIAPQRIEAMLKTVPLVTQAVVFGDKRKQLVALLTLDEQAAQEMAQDQGWQANDFAALTRSAELNKFLRKEIDARSHQLADYEKVGKFTVLPEDLSVEEGELTATMKIKRNVVAKKHKRLIEAMYSESFVPGQTNYVNAR